MSIDFTPAVGQVLECHFGLYRQDENGETVCTDMDARIPPEMVKNRLVVVLNGKINGNACLVVPLSTTRDNDKISRGMHVEVPAEMIEDLHYFTSEVRWAKCDLVQQVSKQRLNRARLQGRGYLKQNLTRELVTELQKAVIKSINASALLK